MGLFTEYCKNYWQQHNELRNYGEKSAKIGRNTPPKRVLTAFSLLAIVLPRILAIPLFTAMTCHQRSFIA
jgi:hypothetical protein